MLRTNLDLFWPNSGEEYLSALKKALCDKRLECLAYINACSDDDLMEFCSDTKHRLKTFYRLSARPHVVDTAEKGTEQRSWGSVRTMELLLSNGRKQTIVIGTPAVCTKNKIMLAIHGTHENARYFLGLIDRPRDGHTYSLGFMLPYIAQGYIVVCTDLPCFGSDYPLENIETQHFTDYIMQVDYAARIIGFPYMNEIIYRHMAVLDFLIGEYGKLDFIGITGFSLGAESAACICACDERIQAVVEYLGTSTFERRLPEVAVSREVSQVMGSGFIDAVGDYWCLGIAICPRPYLRFAMDEDPFVNYSSVQDMAALYRSLYQRKGCDSRFRLVVGQGGHKLEMSMAEMGAVWCADNGGFV